MGPMASSAAARTSHKAPRIRCGFSGRAESSSRPTLFQGFSVLFSGCIKAGLDLLIAPLRGIPAAKIEQLLMPAALDDRAMAQHEDLVGIHDGRQPVGDDDDAAVRTRRAQFAQMLEDGR